MKKIGILTFHNANNYGAVLQAYALKSVLNNLGNTTHILNYYNPKLQKEYKGIPVFKRNLKEIIKYPFKLLIFPMLRKRITTQFNAFRKQYLLDTPPLTPKTIAKKTTSYDVFFSGSDQVFNPRITDFDLNYFLAFSPEKVKNHSYAASFGLSLDNITLTERQFFITNLAHFNKLSVREAQGAQMIKSLSGQEAIVHIDPTLLLTKEDWNKLAVAPQYQKYILLYFMHHDPALISLAKELSSKTGCSILYISHTMHFKKVISAPYVKPTVQEWLGLFMHASYIITTSFHGLAFSVNFNKPFIVGKASGKRSAINSRLDNLLALTGLHNRLYTPSTKANIFDAPIDWANVNNTLAQERQKALRYLREITQC